MCCSFLTANVSANDVDLSIPTESYISLAEEKVNENNISVSKLPDGSLLEGIETISAKPYGISTYSNSSDISTYATADFVMELAYYVVNPESMINDAFTTDTLVYWFWTYNGVNYTYDPAGYDMIDYEVVGIDENEFMYLLDDDNNPIGFATLFSEAGQHTFGYYAMNSNGDVCFKAFTRNIEPADGNNRPVAYLQVVSGPFYNNEDIIFDWSQSYDLDSNDYVVDTRISVYNYYTGAFLTENTDYTLSRDDLNKRFTLNFPNTGTYYIEISVSDNHNNWSNWSGGSITINETPYITLADTSWSDSKVVRSKPAGSNSYVYHTLWSRLGGEIRVDSSNARKLSSYTNHNGTYYNVYMAPIAAGTLFSASETWTSSSNENVYTDPVFGKETPRRITQAEIDYLEYKNMNYYIVYTANLQVVDFYSDLNPLVKSGWSQVSYK